MPSKTNAARVDDIEAKPRANTSKHRPRVSELAPNKKARIYPSSDCVGCAVLLPEAQSTYVVALYVGRSGRAVTFQVPNQQGVLKVDLPSGFFTPKESIAAVVPRLKPTNPPTIGE